MKKIIAFTAILAASTFALSVAHSADARSFTVFGISLGMTANLVQSSLTQLDPDPSSFEFPTHNVFHFAESPSCGWMQKDWSTPKCIGIRVLSVNQGDNNYNASEITLIQRFDTPIDVLSFKKKLIETYGNPDFTNVSLDTYDEKYRTPAFIWSENFKSASKQTVNEMRDWVKFGYIKGAKGALLRVFLNSDGQRVSGMTIVLSDQDELRKKHEQENAALQNEQTKKEDSALENLRFR
ncbi:hypothetical protein [Ochrobactrum soli]|uniref:Uncharacterized protein n=1 Tax=Ochrobactrum soli TaxID=2448455 RepID=A0A849KWT2_9HYPH|nr:hypothetical protein [[Ochrobactrum] soli]NNU62908.1 hypothetical protein [[Ochrobactrum] soli]